MLIPSLELYNELNKYENIERLIENGESEGLYLECKAPSKPSINREQKAQLAKAISGFSNTEGGVIIYGVSTTNDKHTNLDILTQIEPIGACQKLALQIQSAIPALSTPSITKVFVKTIKQKASDTRGLIVCNIPKTTGDPVRSTTDNHFYFRSGDNFVVAPYEMVKRLFAATESPDMAPDINANKIHYDSVSKNYDIPITLVNNSSAIGENVELLISFLNPEICEILEVDAFNDVSHINPGKKMFAYSVVGDKVVHRGINLRIGSVKIKLKGRNRILKLEISIYANKMRAKSYKYQVDLTSSHRKVKLLQSDFLY